MIWHNPTINPPELFHSVLLATRINPAENDGRTHEASEGYRLVGGRGYKFATGHTAKRVYAWAEIPTPPNPKTLDPGWVSDNSLSDDEKGLS